MTYKLFELKIYFAVTWSAKFILRVDWNACYFAGRLECMLFCGNLECKIYFAVTWSAKFILR